MASSPSDVVSLSFSNDTSVKVHLFGATVISWICKGKEILFVSEKSHFDNKKAIRGGIPIVFPNFGPWHLGPQHGFARIQKWQVEQAPTLEENGEYMTAIFSLKDNEETRKMWNHAFKLFYKVRLSEHSLSCCINILNTGVDKFDFTFLLHNYFRVPDIENVKVEGLEGNPYIDQLMSKQRKVETPEAKTIGQNVDSIYTNSNSRYIIHSSDLDYDVIIEQNGLPDVVLWNPWMDKAKAMSDFGDLEYKNMLCIEPGLVSIPRDLWPNLVYYADQTLSII